jgi:hypothetical protein
LILAATADAGRLIAKRPWRHRHHQAWIGATELLMTAAERGGSIERATEQIEGALFLSHMLVLGPAAARAAWPSPLVKRLIKKPAIAAGVTSAETGRNPAGTKHSAVAEP